LTSKTIQWLVKQKDKPKPNHAEVSYKGSKVGLKVRATRRGNIKGVQRGGGGGVCCGYHSESLWSSKNSSPSNPCDFCTCEFVRSGMHMRPSSRRITYQLSASIRSADGVSSGPGGDHAFVGVVPIRSTCLHPGNLVLQFASRLDLASFRGRVRARHSRVRQHVLQVLYLIL